MTFWLIARLGWLTVQLVFWLTICVQFVVAACAVIVAPPALAFWIVRNRV